MLPSAEVRWFSDGDLPETILERFRSGEITQDRGTVEERRDVYLYLPGVDSLGIKLRGTSIRREFDGDKLEIKRRELKGRAVTFISGATGRLENWTKWAFNSESSDPQLSSMLTAKDEAWMSVSKMRYLRRYAVISDKSVVAVPLYEWPENGCNVEITKLIAPDGQRWWTFGFETFGEVDAPIDDNLMLSANHFFAETGLGICKEKDSYGYPRWLNVVKQSGE